MKQFFLILIILICGCHKTKKPQVLEEVPLTGSSEINFPERLSEWGFFEKPMHLLTPVAGIIPYDLNTPLFSDYSQKARFVSLPEGKQAVYDSAETMHFPKGTILIKNFYYQNELQSTSGTRRLIETRLLINEGKDWQPLTYVWNDEQTEGYLEIAGQSVPVSWKDEKGVLQQVNYSVPNLAQCKSCHERSGSLVPIGPTARQLNRLHVYGDETANQLTQWQKLGLLTAVPPTVEWPVIPVWDDEATGTLDERARAWLEINCANCHSRVGPAKNTGLYLTYNENDAYKLGIWKPPVAAGRGSGGLSYSIVPGAPDRSILVHRIESLDPGVMMPEVGRKMRHEEGIALIREWIKEMEPQ